MKNTPMHLTLISTLAFSALSLGIAGCSKSDREKAADKAESAYEQTTEAVTNTWQDVKNYTFERRAEFDARVKAMSSELDAKISKLEAQYDESKASASRKAAMETLKSSRAEFGEKMKALGSATADTWDSAKSNVVAAWDRLAASYDKAKADAM